MGWKGHSRRRCTLAANAPAPTSRALNVFDCAPQPELVAVQDGRLTDPDALAQLSRMPDHETAVLVPRTLLVEYARAITGEKLPA